MGLDMYLEVIPTAPCYDEVMYWRKSNAIHRWFVQNVQNGVDDCDRYPVTWKQLNSLLKTCKMVLKNHQLSSSLLPPQEGFFFGSTEVDENYFEDLKNTVKKLKDVLKVYPEDQTFYYYSSW